jgi:uncharacterized protein YbaP (TraB family)
MKLSTLLLVAALLGLAAPAAAAPGIWEVRDDDSAIWLFGSFHVLPEGTEWRTELFDNIMVEADKIVFETDVRPEAMSLVGADAYVRGIYTDGTLLTQTLSPELSTQLRETMAEIGMPMGLLQAMRPWMAANTISVQALAAAGYNEQGVEFVLLPELSKDRLQFLESGAEQIEVLAGAPEDEQIALLQSTLDELGKLPKMMDKMMRSWAGGTPERLEHMFLMEMGGFEEAFLERLLYVRNRNWIAPLEAMLVENQEHLVVVGAAHLIGDKSVLDLLEQAGYEIERIQ